MTVENGQDINATSGIKISVIIPVYGVERYIERCARSLFEQTLTDDVEFIFVDDCTPDKSIDLLKAILEDYPTRKEQVRIVRHKQNRGLPQARKTGIEESCGTYVLNVDSDDWIEHDALELLLERATSTNADIVVFDFFVASDYTTLYPKQKVEADKLLVKMLKSDAPWSVWNKMFRRTLYFEPTPITFPTLFMSEDLVQSYQLVRRAQCISYLTQPLYYYRRQELSANINQKAYELCIFEQIKKNVELLIDAEHIDDEQPLIADRLRMIAKSQLSPAISPCISRKIYLATYPELNARILLNPYTPIRSRISHLAVMAGGASLVSFIKRLINRYKLACKQ